MRTFDTSKLRSPSGSLDDHALPSRTLFDNAGGRVGLPTIPGSPNPNRRSMPPPQRNSDDRDHMPAIPRPRQTSFKKKVRQSADIASEKWTSYLSTPKSGQMNGSKSLPSSANLTVQPCLNSDQPVATLGSPSTARQTPSGDAQEDVSIEKRVLEMAGLGIGLSPSATLSAARRIHSDTPPKSIEQSADMTRSKSADRTTVIPDTTMLREIAEIPANSRCADCGKGMKSSRWATLSRSYGIVRLLI